MEKDTEISKDDAKNIEDENDVLMEVPTAASERGLEVVIDTEKEYGVFETWEKHHQIHHWFYQYLWKRAI